MAIAEIVEAKAVEGYIKHEGNGTLTYMAAHPNAEYDTARSSAGNFIATHNIEQKAIAVLEANKKLNAKTILNSLTNEIEATKSTYIRGNKNLDPDYAVRLAAKKMILLDLYGLGKSENNIIQENKININIAEMTLVSKEIKDLTAMTSSFMNKLNNSEEI